MFNVPYNLTSPAFKLYEKAHLVVALCGPITYVVKDRYGNASPTIQVRPDHVVAASPPLALPLTLPMIAMIAVTNHPHKTIAHALDFDLVSVAASEEEAIAKVRLAIKHHIEFGIKNDLNLDIRFPAPQKFWEAL